MFATGVGNDEAKDTLLSLKAQPLLWEATVAAVFALVFDLLQYAWGALLYGIFFWALNAQLDPRGTGHGIKYRVSARVARLFSLYRYVESLDEKAGEAEEFSIRRERLRGSVLAPSKELTDLLDGPASPSWISAGVNLFFVLKTLALTWSYLQLLRYFLGC